MKSTFTSRISLVHIIVLYFCFALLSVFLLQQGPSGDEGIYILAGLELLNGAPDSYSSWHNGSPYIWPILAGSIFSVSNLFILRLFTSLLGCLILWFTFQINRSFHSYERSVNAVILICTFGSFFSLIQLAAYDILGLFFFAASLYFILRKTYFSTCFAGVLFGFSVLTKYAFIIFSPAVLLFVLFAIPKQRAISASLFVLATTAIVLTHNLIVFSDIVPISYQSYEAIGSIYNSLYSIGISIFTLFPLFVYAVLYRKEVSLNTSWKFLFWFGLLIWPIFHIVTGNPVSANKHLMYALVFSSPLLVFLFEKAVDPLNVRSALLILTLFGIQFFVIFQSWLNLQPANEYLETKVVESSKIISNAGTYRSSFYLFDKMPNVSNQLVNFHSLSEEERANPDEYDFILWKYVTDSSLTTWLKNQKEDFEEVYSYTDWFIGAEDHLPYGVHNIKVSIFRQVD